MILIPSIFNGLIGISVITFLALSLFIFPSVFADNTQNVWKIVIPKGAAEQDKSVKFYPDELPVFKGDKIEWVNQDSVAHSITSGVPKYDDYFGYFFDAGVIQPGKSSSITIKSDESFAFYYLCKIHPWLTGKLFYQDSDEALAETDNPITLDHEKYFKNDNILIKGQVHHDFWGSKYDILVYDESKNLIDVEHGQFDKNSEYTKIITTESNQWDSNGKYLVKIIYGLPSKVSEISFDFSNTSMKNDVPVWIKNVGGYWCHDKISEAEFVNAIQHLVSKKIINVKNTQPIAQNTQNVPEWIKNNTCWWSENQISDFDFLSGIEFLINKGTIRI